jgi:agmatinase
MTMPDFEFVAPLTFGALRQEPADFDRSRAVILPIPFERTTCYVAGTRNGPREILLASSQMELWDEENLVSASDLGIYTLPEMELPYATMQEALGEIARVAAQVFDAGKFLVSLGGEHSLTIPLVEAASSRHPGLSVLQIDAHADLREAYMGNRFSHASVMRRVVERAHCTQVAIRSLSEEEARVVPSLNTAIFYDVHMRNDAAWMDRVVESLGDPVYVTIDCDGFDPAIMPAVGTPEPGGLSWHEGLTLLRKVFAARRVVACDVVELSPLPGIVAANFLCARLVCKLITYWTRSRTGA